MGGTTTGAGNVTATAEFNFWYDPEAAFVVLDRIPKSVIIEVHLILKGQIFFF